MFVQWHYNVNRAKKHLFNIGQKKGPRMALFEEELD